MNGWRDAALRQVEREKAAGKNHWASHYMFAKKVLRISPPVASMLARGYSDIPLTPELCDDLIKDFADEATA